MNMSATTQLAVSFMLFAFAVGYDLEIIGYAAVLSGVVALIRLISNREI
jgi:hypothetical protein